MPGCALHAPAGAVARQREPDWPEGNDTLLGPPGSLLRYKFQFIVLLHRTTKYVIPRRGEAPTWESPGTMFVLAAFFDRLYQEIATSHG